MLLNTAVPTTCPALYCNSRAGVNGIPTAQNKDTLVEILQNMIFTAGPYHAAVNFPQYEYMAFAPNQPLSTYKEINFANPKPGGFTEDDFVELLPRAGPMLNQLNAMEALAGYRYDELADYTDYDLPPSTKPAVTRFRARLNEIAATIALRNRKRRLDYKYLLPSNIPNSTSV